MTLYTQKKVYPEWLNDMGSELHKNLNMHFLQEARPSTY